MIFLKKCFVTTTEGVDVLSIIHDIRYAIRDAKAIDGMVTVIVPEAGAGLLLGNPSAEFLGEIKREAVMMNRSLTIPIAKGELILGPREEVMLIDRGTKPARREFTVQVFAETPPEKPEPGRRPPPRK